MSRLFRVKVCAAAAAASAGALLLAAPAHAAPTAPEMPAAAFAPGSPNVTVKVIGKLPKLQGPMDVYTQGDTSAKLEIATPAISTLPYSFTFTGVYDLYGREFTSTKSSICTDVEATYSDEAGYSDFRIKLWPYSGSGYYGETPHIPIDGVARSYCWSGVPTGKGLHFEYLIADDPKPGSGSLSKIDGSGQVRYP